MSFTFILEKNNGYSKGYINEFPNQIIKSECIPSLKMKLKSKLKSILGNKVTQASIKTIIKFY